uniref:Uncharacterized protein n=1 Tax=Anguilla anguilla TaxID=7936 RepID=A0A0E9RYY5_ANGAN
MWIESANIRPTKLPSAVNVTFLYFYTTILVCIFRSFCTETTFL